MFDSLFHLKLKASLFLYKDVSKSNRKVFRRENVSDRYSYRVYNISLYNSTFLLAILPEPPHQVIFFYIRLCYDFYFCNKF